MQYSRQELLAIIRSVAYVATSDDEVANSEYDFLGNLVTRGFNASVELINEGMAMSQFQTFMILSEMSSEKKEEVLNMWIGMMKADNKIRQSEIETIKFMCSQINFHNIDIDSIANSFAQNGNGKFRRLARPVSLEGTTWKSTDGSLKIAFDKHSVNGSQYNGEFAIYQYNTTTKKLTFDIIDYEEGIGYQHAFDVISLNGDTMELNSKKGRLILKKQ